MELELYDCTLREGEQAAGAHFDADGRVELFKALDDFGIDFIEVGWPIVSKEIFDSFAKCKSVRKNAKIVAFGSTAMSEDIEGDKNLNSIVDCRPDYACIFGKSGKEHVEKQLKITEDENLERIEKSVRFLVDKGLGVFYDAEHFFDSYNSDEEYALKTLKAAAQGGAERIILCDTNGGVMPKDAEKIVRETRTYLGSRDLDIDLGVHFHDDCGLALANVLECLPNVKQVQGTINGLGERIGGLNLSVFLSVLKKKHKGLDFDLSGLKKLNENSYKLMGVDIPEIRQFVGDTAFAHKGGVHIDATNKGASYEHAVPSDYGNKRIILLNTLGGKSGVVSVAKGLGVDINKNDEGVTKKVDALFEELGDLEKKGYKIGALGAEQFLLIEKYFGNLRNVLEVKSWDLKTSFENGHEESEFFIKAVLDGADVEERLKIEGGPIDCAYKTMQKIISRKYPEIEGLELLDFHVGIARYHAEESSVRTIITFKDGADFELVGVDVNLIESAIIALTKGFRYYLNKIDNKTLIKQGGDS